MAIKISREFTAILIVSALLAVILLAYLLRETVKEIIVIPLLYAYGYARFYLGSIPQAVIWLAAVLSIAVIAIISLRKGTVATARARTSYAARAGRVETLAGWVRLSSAGIYYNWRLANHLAGLLLRIIEQESRGNKNQRLSIRHLATELGESGISLPKGVADYLAGGVSLSGTQIDESQAAGISTKIGQFIAGLFNNRAVPKPRFQEIENTIEYLENRIGRINAD